MATAKESKRIRDEYVEMCNDHIKSCELQLSGNPDIDARWVVGTGDHPVWVNFAESGGKIVLAKGIISLFKVYQFTDQGAAHRVARSVFNGRGERGLAYKYRDALELSMKEYAKSRDHVAALP